MRNMFTILKVIKRKWILLTFPNRNNILLIETYTVPKLVPSEIIRHKLV